MWLGAHAKNLPNYLLKNFNNFFGHVMRRKELKYLANTEKINGKISKKDSQRDIFMIRIVRRAFAISMR